MRRALGLADDPDLEDIAQQAADDALLAVHVAARSLRAPQSLHDLGLQVRNQHGGRRSATPRLARPRAIASSPDGSLEQLADRAQSPAEASETRELLARIIEAITRLTPHQREVLLALAVDGVPIDVLADRLSTNRNALYKTLHDARTRLRGLLDGEETVQ